MEDGDFRIHIVKNYPIYAHFENSIIFFGQKQPKRMKKGGKYEIRKGNCPI